MGFANLVIDAGLEQDALGRGGFPCIDVRRDTNIAIALDWGFAGHDCVLRLPTEMAECLVGLCHLVRVLTLFHCTTAAFGCVKQFTGQRSEESRLGKGCVSTCGSRWLPYH